MQTVADEQQFKAWVKAAFIEAIEERPDLIRGLMEEAMEDIALARAIREGENSGNVSREEIFAVLRGEA